MHCPKTTEANVQRDLDDLKTKTASVRTWATKEISHFGPLRGQFSETVTQDLDGALDIVIGLSAKHRALITDVGLVQAVVMTNWQSVFEVAWLDEEA